MSYVNQVSLENTGGTKVDPATSGKQDTGNTSVASIDTKTPALVGGKVPVDGSGVTQPISAAALPLPAGAATSAAQTTGNSSLSSIDGKLAALGQKTMAGSTPVVLASDQSTVPVSAAALPLPSGAATSALQTTGNTSLGTIVTNTGNIPAKGAAVTANATPVTIASDQTVPVSAAALPLPAGAATAANQATQTTALGHLTDGTQKTQNVDGSGNVIGSVKDILNANFLNVNMIQNGLPDPNNTSSANLAVGATFTGAATATLGCLGIQYSLKCDQNCTVWVDQSGDGVNWDISDPFYYVASVDNHGVTTQGVGQKYRIRVTNTGTATTTVFRLCSGIMPVAEPLPRALSDEGNLKVAIFESADGYGWAAENTPHGESRTVTPTKLVGNPFEFGAASALDTNFWTVTNVTGGTSLVTGSEALMTLTSANAASTKINSLRRARYSSGMAMRFRCVLEMSDAGVANNRRYFGIASAASGAAPTASFTDGAFFGYSGTTFLIGTRKGGADTIVNAGSFNGSLGDSWVPSANTVAPLELYWTNETLTFVVGDEILHQIAANTTTWANTASFYAYAESTNTAASTASTINIRNMDIYRLGPAVSQPTSKMHTGTAGSALAKTGPGNLHRLVVSGITANSVITLYDNTAASGTVIWASGAMSQGTSAPPLYSIDMGGIPFYTGLYVSITAANCNVLAIYE